MGSHYSHLTFEERRKIDKWHDAKMPVPEISDRLDRAASTIYRELKRNYYDDKDTSRAIASFEQRKKAEALAALESKAREMGFSWPISLVKNLARRCPLRSTRTQRIQRVPGPGGDENRLV